MPSPSEPRRVRAPQESRSATARAAAAAPSRRQQSRWQRDQQQTRLLLVLFGTLGTMLVLILAGGLYVDNVVQANDVVAQVGAERITTTQLVNEMRPSAAAIDAQIRQLGAANRSAAAQGEQQKRSLPDDALNQLIQTQLITQEAQRRGIVVSDADVEALMRQNVAEFDAFSNPQATPTPEATAVEGAAPTPSPTAEPSPSAPATPTPVPTLEASAYTAAFQKALAQTGLSEARYRDLVRRQALQERVSKAIGEEVPDTQEQVRARQILLADQDTANRVLAQLRAGADFAQLAAQVSTDPGTKDKGGDLGWFPRGQMNSQFEDAAFSLQPGQISDVVQSPSGYHIIQLLERDPARPVPADQLDVLRTRAFSTWLSARQASPDVKLEMSSAERDWTLRRIGVRP
ncbi:MAG: peptidylprolyl isomerase [Chloroflexi bacterium]|nr:peptidylprolyl isomerase [Chloroflexota bacterium]